MSKTLSALFLLTASSLSFSSYAAAPPGVDSVQPEVASLNSYESEPPILRALLTDKKGKYKFVAKDELGKGMFAYSFKGPAGNPVLVYKTPNNRLVFGDLMNIDGTNHTKQTLVSHGLLKSDMQKFTELEESFYFEENAGMSEPVYIVFDPNCVYCKKLYTQTRNETSTTIRWIPVAYLSESSDNMIASAVSGGGLPALMTGSLSDQSPVTEGLQSDLKKNLETMRDLNFRGAPGVAYMSGNSFKTVGGLPDPVTLSNIFKSPKPLQVSASLTQ